MGDYEDMSQGELVKRSSAGDNRAEVELVRRAKRDTPKAEPQGIGYQNTYKLTLELETTSLAMAGKVEEAVMGVIGERDVCRIVVETVMR